MMRWKWWGSPDEEDRRERAPDEDTPERQGGASFVLASGAQSTMGAAPAPRAAPAPPPSPRPRRAEALHDDRPCRTFEELARRYRHVAWLRARRFTSDPGTADDLVQQALLAMDRHIRGKKGQVPHPVLGLLLQMVDAEAMNHARVARRRRIDGKRDAETMPSSKPSPDEQLGRAEAEVATSELAHRLLERLTPYQRQLLELAHTEEMTLRDMAELLDRPFGTVASDLRRARDELRKLAAPHRAHWNEIRRSR
jgi:RNA polymerase sigma-70 factor (ECF subfamily)